MMILGPINSRPSGFDFTLFWLQKFQKLPKIAQKLIKMFGGDCSSFFSVRGLWKWCCEALKSSTIPVSGDFSVCAFLDTLFGEHEVLPPLVLDLFRL